MDVVFISGTSFNLNDVFTDKGYIHEDYIAYVSKVNEFGFFEIKLNNSDKKIKRHLTNCTDLMQIGLNGYINGIYQSNDGSYHLYFTGDTEDAYVVSKEIDGELCYLARVRKDGIFTNGITLAWFTFDKEQAKRYAERLTIQELTIYTVYNIKDIIKLDSYMEVN